MVAGKAIAAKSKQAREARKKALAEANAIIANNQFKDGTPQTELEQSETKNILATTQWPSVISIGVTLVGIYYKCKEIQSFIALPPPSPVDVAPTSHAIKKFPDMD